MNPLWSSTLLLSISAVYYAWRSWHSTHARRERILRDRVTFMLWKMAQPLDEDETLTVAGAS